MVQLIFNYIHFESQVSTVLYSFVWLDLFPIKSVLNYSIFFLCIFFIFNSNSFWNLTWNVFSIMILG